MNQIVCISTSNWHPYPTSKQQVMSRIQNAEVLYFDPPVSYIARFKDKTAKARLKAYKNGGEKVSGHITVYAMPPVLPFFNKYRFVNKLNQRKLARFVKSKMKQHGFNKPVVWTYSPTTADMAGHLDHGGLVYSCVDRHSGYKGLINPRMVDQMERDLAETADVVFTTAQGLYDTLSPYNSHTALIPNGANYELFQNASRPMPAPVDFPAVTGPVFGFLGALQECIDYSLVLSAAKARPNWSFVFVGAKLPGVDLTELEAMPNIYFLGLKPHNDAPAYLAQFDVCLNLFKSGDLAKDVSPLKFYEYLATEKPIVSTPQPDQVMDYRDVIYVADGSQSFLEQCQAALDEEGPTLREKRGLFALQCSWDARVAQMVKILEQKHIFK